MDWMWSTARDDRWTECEIQLGMTDGLNEGMMMDLLTLSLSVARGCIYSSYRVFYRILFTITHIPSLTYTHHTHKQTMGKHTAINYVWVRGGEVTTNFYLWKNIIFIYEKILFSCQNKTIHQHKSTNIKNISK